MECIVLANRNGEEMRLLFFVIYSTAPPQLKHLFYVIREWAHDKQFRKANMHYGDYISNFMLQNLFIYFLQARSKRIILPIDCKTATLILSCKYKIHSLLGLNEFILCRS